MSYTIMCDRCRIVVPLEHGETRPEGWQFLDYAPGGYHACPGCTTPTETGRPAETIGELE